MMGASGSKETEQVRVEETYGAVAEVKEGKTIGSPLKPAEEGKKIVAKKEKKPVVPLIMHGKIEGIIKFVPSTVVEDIRVTKREALIPFFTFDLGDAPNIYSFKPEKTFKSINVVRKPIIVPLMGFDLTKTYLPLKLNALVHPVRKIVRLVQIPIIVFPKPTSVTSIWLRGSYDIATTERLKVHGDKATVPKEKIEPLKPRSFPTIEEEWEEWQRYVSPRPIGLPALTKLIYVFGLEGMGFDVLRSMLVQEVEDRGRNPRSRTWTLPRSFLEKMQATLSEHATSKGQILKQEMKHEEDFAGMINVLKRESWDDTKIFWVENFPIEVLTEERKMIDEVKDRMTERLLSYVVFTESISRTRSPDEIYLRFSHVLKTIQEIGKTFPSLTFLVLGEKLQLPLKRDDLLVLTKLFVKIKMLNKEDFSIDKIVEGAVDIDCVWKRLEAIASRPEAVGIQRLIDKYSRDKEISSIIPYMSKKDNESHEHFAMKQLVVKELLERGYQQIIHKEKDWELEQADGEKWPLKVEVEMPAYSDSGEVLKVPDVSAISASGMRIWVEAETCRNLEDPLLSVREKLRRIIYGIELEDLPDEIWLVFPYRKLILYGHNALTQYKRLVEEFKSEKLKDKKLKLRLRVFLADFFDEMLRELN
jgi:hypothetical protein